VKAIRVHALGGPEVLKYDEVPESTPKPGEALVRIEAAGVNFIDIYQRIGIYKLALPITLGMEGAGQVTAVGDVHTRTFALYRQTAFLFCLRALPRNKARQ
jgi:NADPH:quinone reductase